MTLSLTGAAVSAVFWFLVLSVAFGAVLGSAFVACLGWVAEMVVEWVEVRRVSRTATRDSDTRNAAAGNATRR